MSAPKAPKTSFPDCPGYEYYAPQAASVRPLRDMTALEQMYAYYEAA